MKIVKSKAEIAINAAAEELGLYDPSFDVEEQCSGYYAFCQLVHTQQKFPEFKMHFTSAGTPININWSSTYTYPSMKLLLQLHTGIRFIAFEMAKIIRKRFGIYNDD